MEKVSRRHFLSAIPSGVIGLGLSKKIKGGTKKTPNALTDIIVILFHPPLFSPTVQADYGFSAQDELAHHEGHEEHEENKVVQKVIQKDT